LLKKIIGISFSMSVLCKSKEVKEEIMFRKQEKENEIA